MLKNNFTKRYKSIPIAKFAFKAEPNDAESYITLPQFHKEFEMLYINSGAVNITANNRSFIAKSGDIILFSPYMFHSIKMIPYSSADYICFCFDLSLLSDSKLIAELEQKNIAANVHILSESVHTPPLRNHFFKINEAVDTEFPYYESTVCGNIILMFAYIFQNNLTEIPTVSSRETAFQTNILDYLEVNYGTDINLSDVAKEFHLDPSYFCRRFKSSFGIRFTDFLRIFRLDKAKRHLKHSKDSITKIALQCGFSSSSHFAHCFKQEYGTTPNDYRKNNR